MRRRRSNRRIRDVVHGRIVPSVVAVFLAFLTNTAAVDDQVDPNVPVAIAESDSASEASIRDNSTFAAPAAGAGNANENSGQRDLM